jgi:hypothetical protein
MFSKACLFLPFICFTLLGPSFGAAEPSTNTNPVTLAAQSIVALTGGNPLTDVTLTGQATWIAGSDTETGTATLLAVGTGESRMDLILSSGTRTEIRDAQTGVRLGEWIAQTGTTGMFARHNCQTDAVWFFPALTSLSGGTNVVFSYVGAVTRNGENVQHIQGTVYQTSSNSSIPLLQLSVMDFYLDATTLLPSAITFNAHPDNNMLGNIPIEIDFSNYEVINGFNVPMHIQKYMQGTLAIDLTLSGSTFNTGVSLSNFVIN